MTLRSPKAHGSRNTRKTIEMPIISLAREMLKSTKRSRTSGRGGRGSGKTKAKERDRAIASLRECGQQPLVPVPCPTISSSPRRPGRADSGCRRWPGPEAAGLVSSQRLGSAVIFSLCSSPTSAPKHTPETGHFLAVVLFF